MSKRNGWVGQHACAYDECLIRDGSSVKDKEGATNTPNKSQPASHLLAMLDPSVARAIPDHDHERPIDLIPCPLPKNHSLDIHSHPKPCVFLTVPGIIQTNILCRWQTIIIAAARRRVESVASVVSNRTPVLPQGEYHVSRDLGERLGEHQNCMTQQRGLLRQFSQHPAPMRWVVNYGAGISR
ncbi:hypothetical protein CEXT_477321 [Caerostris extrusa]|uniref:Uncharacterized protein n=1 Tax=Caerostris extrusa TaxID=172846 RepID=A0AAV4MJQ9_CAEEX|nr:hypothetical protein CEXT_477321 [Caerostris extrusa]